MTMPEHARRDPPSSTSPSPDLQLEISREILMSTGAPSAHVLLKETLSSIRKKDLLQAAVTISGLAHQETHKKQVRAVLSHFQNFLTSLPVTFRHLPLPTLAVLWLQDNLRNNAKIKRITTIHQKARLLQSAFPGQPILRAPILLLYLKGLGRLQPTSPRNLPTASWPQCLRFVRLARETPWTLAAATLIVKGAARWSDIHEARYPIFPCPLELSYF